MPSCRLNMHRFFVLPSWIEDDMVTLSGSVAHQIRDVLRLQAGDCIVVLDDSGWEFQVELTAVGHERVSGTIQRKVLGQTEPRAKVTSKLNQILAELDADASNSLSLILDIYGNVTENSVANFFLVRDGVLWTPPERNILEGITRLAVFDMAERLGISLEERDFTMYDVAQADEFFLSSSVICALPIREVDRFRPKAPVPGPITQRLVEAFVEETGFDFQKYTP